MRNEGLLSVRGLVSIVALVVAGLALAWLCVRTAIVGVLPPNAPVVLRLAPHDPDVVLGRATAVLARPRSRLDAGTLAAVGRAAAVAPLDARPFLLIGRQQLLEGKSDRAVKSLEAGQRLNPRNRFIHLLLVEHYLLANRYGDAAAQLSVLARLINAAQPVIATAMARMLVEPDMQDAVRRALKTDPRLERAVLVALAKNNSEPDTIFALASPTALADAGAPESWGPVLVSRLVTAGRFQAARAVWQKVYKLPQEAVARPVFNPTFRRVAASPPFDWTLTAGSLGAADPRRGTLAVDYYGRESGDLASQLLVLAPGRYQLAFTAEGGKPDGASRLFWTIACAGDGKPVLTNVAVPASPRIQRAASAFTVPAGCPAQTLTLRGEAAEFPSSLNLTIGGVAIRPLAETKP
jgi:cytochrome c-type biogenesis protein CcmH/NrfG